MKLTSLMKPVVTACALAVIQTARAANTQTIPGVAEQPASYFYTGKPYDADLGSYVFNARNYNPEINRWTSADPSGFPNGANNFAYINNQTLNSCDPNGLTMIRLYMTGSEWYEDTWTLVFDNTATVPLQYGWVPTGARTTVFLEDISTPRATAALPQGASWDGDFITTSTKYYDIIYSNQTPRSTGLPIPGDTKDADQFYRINWKRAYTIEE